MLRIVADSSCDLPRDLVELRGIAIVPLSIVIDGEDFREGVDITPQDVYARMSRSAELPKTSQPSPALFAETFDALTGEGSILCVTISSGLSGTYQSACLGSDLAKADVTVFDSLTGSLGLGLQVLRACDLADAGRPAAEVVEELTAYRDEMTTLVLLNTLENIVEGGRLSTFQGSVAKVLDIRVILRDHRGSVVLLERVHGRKKLLERALGIIQDRWPDMSQRDVGITHFNNPEDAEVLRQAMTDACHPRSFIISEMGATMATYAGESGMIVAF